MRKETDEGNADTVSFASDLTTTYDYDENDRLLTEATIDIATPGTRDTNTTYEYGPTDPSNPHGVSTVQTKETRTDAQGTVKYSQTMEYDARGRLSKVMTDKDGSDTGPQVETTYEYDDNGARISQTIDNEKTVYVIDLRNPTGYSQVLEERASDGTIQKTYTLGLDVVSQATASAVYHFLYDFHGSTRAMLSGVGAQQFYAYNANGELLNLTGFTAAIESALTAYLYSGEFRDSSTDWDYLRARSYRDGRFNRLDPFSGSLSMPQSLNKYLYGHSDPISNTDPSGKFILAALLGVTALAALNVGGLLFLDYAQGQLERIDDAYLNTVNADQVVNPSGLWWGGNAGVSSSWGFAGGKTDVGRVVSNSNSNDWINFSYSTLSGGLGAGFTVSSSATFIFNATTIRDVADIKTEGKDTRADIVGNIVKFYGVALEISELLEIARGTADVIRLIEIADKIRAAADIGFGEPTLVSLPINAGVQAFLGYHTGQVSIVSTSFDK